MQTPPDEISYSENFETSLGGWAGGAVTLNTVTAHISTKSMRIGYNATGGANDGAASRTMAVSAGVKYKLTFWARSDVSAAAGVTISTGTTSGAGTTYSLTANSWKLITIRFTPSITAPIFTITGPKITSGSALFIDDINLSYTPSDVAVTTELPIIGGSMQLDEGWSPYVQGRLTIPIPSPEVQERIDPRTNPRILITCVESFPDGSMPDVTRSFDLFIRERTVSHRDGTIELRVESDEALLWDYARLGNTALPASTTSAVTAVKETLALVVPSSVPLLIADLTNKPTITRTNLITNPSAFSAVTGWTASAGATLARSTVWGIYGPASFAITPSSSTISETYMEGTFTLVAGRTYTVSGTLHLAAAQTGNVAVGRARSIQVVSNSGSGAAILGGSAVAANVAGDTRLSFTFSMPDSTTGTSTIRFYNGTQSGGGVAYWDGLLLEVTDENRPYFDGSFLTSGEVAYAWTGTAHASTSTALVRAHVAADALLWLPGQTAGDYLSGLLDATSMRLHCDEQRVWRITDNSYSVPGSLRIAQGRNLTQGSDTMSRINGTWYSGVQITYSYEDRNGVSQVRYDFAGTPGKVYALELAKAFPGAGAAAYILSRANGRGRTFDLTSVSDFTAKPGQEIVATLPATPIVTGYVSAVSYDFGTAEMSVTSRALLDTPPTAWILQPDDLTWEGVPNATTWTTYTAS